MKDKVNDIPIKIYRRIFDVFAKLKYPLVKRFYSFPKVKSFEETLDDIITNRKSIARFGDGELHMLSYVNIGFQNFDKILSKRLIEIISDYNNTECLIALPSSLQSLRGFTPVARSTFKGLIGGYYHKYHKHINKDFTYSNAFITRPYMDYFDKSQASQKFELLKKIWVAKDVVIIEGSNTRFGVGNNLLKNSNSVERVLCPSKNAFDIYTKIVDFVIKNVPKEKLLLIALGPTATVLAYDLSRLGYQAIDIGHADIEYEWFLKKSQSKIAINNKAVNEVKNGYSDDSEQKFFNDDYSKQIIVKLS